MFLFPSFPHFPDTRGNGIIYDVMIGLHKFADVIITITEKPLYIPSLNLLR